MVFSYLTLGKTMKRLSIILAAALASLVACTHEPAAVSEARALYWAAPDGGLAAHAGNLSASEVDRIRSDLAKISFPAKQALLQSLIPPTVKPKAIMHWDNFREDEKGRFGGMVEDYWLNPSTVLRVATAYYRHENRYESAEIINAARAYTEQPGGVSLRR